MNPGLVHVKDLILIPVEPVSLSDVPGLCTTMAANMQEAKLFGNFAFLLDQRYVNLECKTGIYLIIFFMWTCIR